MKRAIAGWAGVFVGCAGVAVVVLLVTASPRAVPRDDLASLPAAARGPISAALGAGAQAYRVTGLTETGLVARNPAQGLVARFGRTGVEVRSGSARFGISLDGFGRGAGAGSLAQVAPRLGGSNRVTYSRGAVSEWWANGPLGLEQGFDLAQRPAGTAPLTFSLAVSGSARIEQGTLLLPGGLRYAGLEATDARGHTLPAWLGRRDGRLLVRVDDRGAVYPVHVDPFVQKAELTAGDGAASDNFGFSVAISGDTIAVGSINANGGQGAVYVFTMPASGWANGTQTAVLTASDGVSADQLGYSVAISGTTIAAGAINHAAASHAQQGAVYVYTMPSGGWASHTQTAELTAADGAASDHLGTSVAVSGTTIVAGAPNHKVGSNATQGAAYVFAMPATGWATGTQTAELTGSDGAASDNFGRAVAISDATIAVGSPFHAVGSNTSQGAVYEFTMPSAGWANATQTAELTAGDGAATDELGWSVAALDNTIVAGARNHKVGSNASQGAVYVFAMPSAGWATGTQTAELTAGDGATTDNLGYAVAVSGSTVVAGAIGHEVGSNSDQGAAYVFLMPSGGWVNGTQAAELTASDGAANDFFGSPLGISGDTIVGGSYFHAVGSHAGQGAAYVFVRPGPSISITKPAAGETYPQHSVAFAAYTCTPSSGTTVASCTGSVANGGPIDTTVLGPRTVTITATDADGGTASQTATYTVVAPPPVVKPVAPKLSSVHQSAATWRETKKPVPKLKKQPPVGTTFAYTLNVKATVKFAFTLKESGRKVAGRCVAQTRKNLHKPACTRRVADGTLTLAGRKGANRAHFAGRLSKTKTLRPGRYTLALTATASGRRSAKRSLSFTIAG